jgi:hypothetical protein
MTWRRRLIELACAGGALASQSSCVPIVVGGCGNANPDPCVCGRTPDPQHSPQCIAEQQCKQMGGFWEFFGGSNATTDAGVTLEGRCEGYQKDAGIDAPPPDVLVHDGKPLG